MLEKKDVAKFLFLLAKGVPTFAPDLKDGELIGIWHHALQSFTEEQLHKAAMQLIVTETHFPPIARVLQLLSVTQRETFDDLVKLISKHGGYRPPEGVSYALAMTINRMGGWQKICDWTNDELPFRKKEFDECYQSCSDLIRMAKPEHLHPETLKGIHASTESHATKQTDKLISAKPEEAAKEPEKKKIDWDAVCAAHMVGVGPNRISDVDLNLPEHLKDRGFFKLYSKPGFFYRYCHGTTPATGWPLCFVDAEKHVAEFKAKQGGEQYVDPNKFDPNKYSYEKFTD